MPCWTIKKTQVNVSTMQLPVLAEGLKAAGFDVKLEEQSLTFARVGSYEYHRYEKGVLTINGQNVESLTAEVKRAYSAQIIKQGAAQFGWNVQIKPHTNQFIVQRRR